MVCLAALAAMWSARKAMWARHFEGKPQPASAAARAAVVDFWRRLHNFVAGVNSSDQLANQHKWLRGTIITAHHAFIKGELTVPPVYHVNRPADGLVLPADLL
jgi:hypothetical protein